MSRRTQRMDPRLRGKISALVLPAVRLKAAPNDAVERLRRLVSVLGHNQAAAILGVDRSQLSRCIAGKETLTSALARRIADLDYVLARALQVFQLDEAGPWLTQSEPQLGGAIPLNVLVLQGPARVIGALDAIEAGAFA